MSRKRRISFWLGLVLALVGAAGAGELRDLFEPPAGAEPDPSPSATVPAASAEPGDGRPVGVPLGAQEGRVAKIVDGDTIWVAIEEPGGGIPVGDDHRVRMLEIDTPETARPDYPVQCGGKDAGAFAKAELPLGSPVYLLADREDKDSFGRYLRYVWDFEGEFYNEKAISEGLARAVLYPPNDLYITRLRQAEALAKQGGKGVWGEACAAAQ